MSKPQAGDIGTKIRYNAQESLADETVLKLKYKNADGVTGEWPATVYQVNYAEYITLVATDLVAGTMEIQIYIEAPGWKGHSEIKKFTVEANVS